MADQSLTDESTVTVLNEQTSTSDNLPSSLVDYFREKCIDIIVEKRENVVKSFFIHSLFQRKNVYKGIYEELEHKEIAQNGLSKGREG